MGEAIIIIFIGLIISFKIYETMYYKSEKFTNIKNRVKIYIDDSNNLNDHIEELKNTYIGYNQLDYGNANYQDASKWNFKRKEFAKHNQASNIYKCSRSVCDNARKQPFKYICKYFEIEANEQNLEKYEKILNNFEAAEQGKISLQTEKANILNSISSEIPWLIKNFSKKKLSRKLGFKEINLSTAYFPRYLFQYVSSGGNASLKCEVIMDLDNLNRFVEYLNEKIKWKKSAAGQRALMTSRLRQHILQRDNYTCQNPNCGVSIHREPNLLLEIDHIVPISKGGLTSEENLQTLCWRCNRSKGAKVPSFDGRNVTS